MGRYLLPFVYGTRGIGSAVDVRLTLLADGRWPPPLSPDQHRKPGPCTCSLRRLRELVNKGRV